MALPTEPVTLSVEQIEELNRMLSTMRHDVNNHLMLIMTAVELFRLKPENSERMLTMMVEQPQKIAANITKFAGELEATLRITRP
jgi:23S rRNA C2498 (ribose-2'-O)-methylase RlmM